jgi:hypothetical protein
MWTHRAGAEDGFHQVDVHDELQFVVGERLRGIGSPWQGH